MVGVGFFFLLHNLPLVYFLNTHYESYLFFHLRPAELPSESGTDSESKSGGVGEGRGRGEGNDEGRIDGGNKNSRAERHCRAGQLLEMRWSWKGGLRRSVGSTPQDDFENHGSPPWGCFVYPVCSIGTTEYITD